MLYVEKGTPAHAFELAFKLRSLDKYEIALNNHTPLDALINPFRFTNSLLKSFTLF